MLLARPMLSYGNEACTIRMQEESRLTSTEMKIFIKIAGCNFWTRKLISTHNNPGTYRSTHSRIHTSAENKLAAARRTNGTLFTANKNVSLRPQRKMVNGKTSTEMAEDRNSPIGLLPEKEVDDEESLRTVCTTKARSTYTDETNGFTYVNTDMIRHGGMSCTTKQIYIRS